MPTEKLTPRFIPGKNLSRQPLRNVGQLIGDIPQRGNDVSRAADVLRDELHRGYDVVSTSLFLHHLDEDEAVQLLEKMKRASRGLVLVNDLRRSRLGVALASVCPRLLTGSDVVRADALRSARAAFTLPEARDLAARAGLVCAEVAVGKRRFLRTAAPAHLGRLLRHRDPVARSAEISSKHQAVVPASDHYPIKRIRHLSSSCRSPQMPLAMAIGA